MPHAVPPPRFPVDLAAPDLAPWRAGSHGLAGVHCLDAAAPGPHVALLALMHGNEIAGAILLDRLLRVGLRPARGRLSLAFLNLDAFDRFDPAQPTLSRFIDEDLNRVWDPALLDGPVRSRERDRARALRPFLDTVDIALDLHSMLWEGDPLLLCGQTARGRALGRALGTPALVVADAGHPGGRRLIDYPRFAAPEGKPTALLLEAGSHWRDATLATTEAVVAAFLGHVGVVDQAEPAPQATPPLLAEVTHAITATSANFAFVQPWRSGTVLARRNSVIAFDGPTEIRTPYDECLLVMPSLRASRGHVAVRLARFL